MSPTVTMEPGINATLDWMDRIRLIGSQDFVMTIITLTFPVFGLQGSMEDVNVIVAEMCHLLRKCKGRGQQADLVSFMATLRAIISDYKNYIDVVI